MSDDKVQQLDTLISQQFKAFIQGVHKAVRDSDITYAELNAMSTNQAFVDGIEMYFGNVEYPSKFVAQMIIQRQ